MNRKEFLFKTSAAALGIALTPSLIGCSAQRIAYEPLTVSAGNLQRVRGNVSRYVNKGGTIGLLETKDGFIVIDSQFPDSVQAVIDSISKKGKPIEFLANTHHHGDHTGGNIAFKDLTKKIVAHERVPELQRLAAEERSTLDQQLYANILFSKQHKMRLGGEKVVGYHLGTGHTFGDVVYHFEKDNVVHMGDLMFINMIPVYRPKDGADSNNWIKTLDAAIEKFDNDTLFIFGHSDKPETSTGTKADLVDMRNFLIATNDFVRRAIKEGKSTEKILKDHAYIPGFPNRKTPQRFADFIKAVRETLENS